MSLNCSPYPRKLGATEKKGNNMLEKVMPQGDDMPMIVVQFHPEWGTLGFGLEPRDDVPSKHFVDQIYGDVPTQTKIGKIFWEQKSQLIGDTMFNAVDLDSDEEAEFYNTLGRAILDSVTGSSTKFGMWTWLDRASSNRLIRLIRKGRDTTFGRDE